MHEGTGSGDPWVGRSDGGPTPTVTTSVSAVIVSHNEGELLRSTVDSFLGSSSHLDELVVVDDRSTDESTAFLEEDYEGVVLLRTEEQLGISRARNYGARHSKGDVIVFSDAHVEVSDDWLSPLLAALADPDVGEVAPGVGYLDGRPGIGYGFSWASPSLEMAWLYGDASRTHDVPFICGCFLALRREVFEATGGFDEGMYRWGFEDSELSLRIWLAGYRCQSAPASFIRHQFRSDFPYGVDRSGVVYNALRLATVHFDEPAIERVVAHYMGEQSFGPAWARLMDSDTWDRREAVRHEQARGFREVTERFGIDALG
jgi:glycosyltransferase involved in cell wall biosynthesis